MNNRSPTFLLDGASLDPNDVYRDRDDADLVNLASLTKDSRSQYDFFEYREGSDIEANETGEDATEQLIDESPIMPPEYYNELENFLNRPAPKISGGGSNAIMNKKSKSGTGLGVTKPSTQTLISSVKPKISAYTQVKKKLSLSAVGAAMNDDLLKEAFAYTDRLMQIDATADEEMELDEMTRAKNTAFAMRERLGERITCAHPSSAPSRINAAYAEHTQTKKIKKGTNGLVKKLRSQTNVSTKPKVLQHNDFSTCAMNETLSNVNKVDFDSLVNNFEQGLTLRKLQQDLLESKNSMQKSENFVKQLTREFAPVVARRGLKQPLYK